MIDKSRLELGSGGGVFFLPPGDEAVLEFTGTYPCRYSPTHKPMRYDCLIRASDGRVRRYMVARDDSGGRRGWAVWWNEIGDESGGGFKSSLESDAVSSLKKGKALCQAHYDRRPMPAPVFVAINAHARPIDDREILDAMIAAHRKNHKGCSAPFCNHGRIYNACGASVICASCGGKGQDDFIQQEAK